MVAAMSTASSAIKTGVFTLLVPLVVAVWVPRRLIANGSDNVAVPLALRVIGVLLFTLGALGYFWCAALFVRAQGTPVPISPPRRTVVGGLYRINRNPMYTSVLTVIFGQTLFYQSLRLAEYGLFLAVCFHLFVVLYEERDLRARFDGEYEDFCQRVPRWIPRVRGSSRT